MSQEIQNKVSETYQSYNLYGDIVVLSVQDRIGQYIDQELGVFRSDDKTADFRIKVSPLSVLDGKLHQIGKLQEVQYLIHTSTKDRYVGIDGVYWRFDEMGYPYVHVFYARHAGRHRVWTIVEQWIKLSFLQQNWIAVHSCAFIYRDVPVVVVGWRDLGKSRLLHCALEHGAAYMSDDFTLASASGQIRGYPPAAVDVSNNTQAVRHGSNYPSQGIIRKAVGSAADLLKSSRVVRRVARRLADYKMSIKRVRMDMLHPDMEIVLKTSEALWVILLPAGDWPQKIYTKVPVSEAVERIIASTLTDYYFAWQYDKYLYLSGRRVLNDDLILNARNMHRDIVLAALKEARGIWAVDSEMVISSPESVLELVGDSG